MAGGREGEIEGMLVRESKEVGGRREEGAKGGTGIDNTLLVSTLATPPAVSLLPS